MRTVSDIRRRKKLILLGQPICHVIYYQLQGHLTIIFNVLFGFSISEQTGIAFFWYEYLGIYVNPQMVTNTLWLRGVSKCEIFCLPPPFHTGTPHMVMGTVFLAIHLDTH
jgi:hypothetical protein